MPNIFTYKRDEKDKWSGVVEANFLWGARLNKKNRFSEKIAHFWNFY